MSSAVNPDAVHVPLATLAAIYSFVHVRDRTHARALFTTVVLAALTKPTAPLMLAAVACAVAGFLVLRRIAWRDAWSWARVAGLGWSVAWFGFYAWSPPRFYGLPRPDTNLQEYLDHVGEVAFIRWTQYWGRLGWLDYAAHPGWYVWLLWIFAASSALALWRARGWWRQSSFALFAILFGIAYFAGTVAGEFLYLPVAGFTFQGRYLLPASIAVAMLLLEHWASWRIAIVLYVAALSVVLAQETVHRYYDGSWSRLWRAQAFSGDSRLP
jgi:hypothetical protein